MNKKIIKNKIRDRRHGRVRAKVFGTAEKPRLSVFRSINHISVQLIDDESGKTLASADDKNINLPAGRGTKVEKAEAVGKLIAEKAKAKKIKQAVFDKGHGRFHGRIKAVADSVRKAGLKI